MKTGDEIDRQIREALEPADASVRRVVEGALATRTRKKPLFIMIASGFAVVFLCLILFLGPPAEPTETLRLDYVGEVAVLQAEDGSSWVFSPQRHGEGSTTNVGLIIVEGDQP